MGVGSDDGFRLSEGYGLKRQVLHVTGTGIDTDVAAVVSTTNYLNYGNGGFGATLPQTPISGPVFFVNSNNYTLGGSINLTGKVAVVDINLRGITDDALLCYFAQTNGAIAVITINVPTNGLPYRMSGTPPAPLEIPALNVSGDFGQRDFWVTNQNLTASIGAAVGIVLGEADYGRGDAHSDFGFVVPVAGAYPLHLTYFGGPAGDNNVEWSVLTGGIAADGTRSLINGTTNSPSLTLLAYQSAGAPIPRPTLGVSKQGGTVTITFTGTLQSSTNVNGTYQDLSDAHSPYTVPTGSSPAKFYRSHR